MAADAHLIRAIRGPITMITLGVLFSLDHFTPYGFSQTWPVLLIVFGLLSLLRRGVTRSMEQAPPWGGPPGTPPWGGQPGSPPWGGPPGTPPWAPPQPQSTGSSGAPPSGGGYRQSPYGASSGPKNAGQPSGGPQ